MTALRKYLLAGIVALAPFLVTVALINWLIELSDAAIALLPPQYRPEALVGIDIPGLGVVLAVLFIILIGMVTTHFIGNQLMRWIDRIMERIPLVRTIYKATRQLFEATLSDNAKAFERVVMVPFPDRSTMVIGFVTGEMVVLMHGTRQQRISVFVPSTPMPTTGWLLFVDVAEIVSLEMSVEEGMKLVLSGGTLPAANREKTQ